MARAPTAPGTALEQLTIARTLRGDGSAAGRGIQHVEQTHGTPNDEVYPADSRCPEGLYAR